MLILQSYIKMLTLGLYNLILTNIWENILSDSGFLQ